MAEELLTDIELKRLKASEVVLKANRLARLVGHDRLLRFLELERNGYSTDASSEWIGRAGRWSDEDNGRYFPQSVAKVEAGLHAAREAMKALAGGGNYSGERAATARYGHDQAISSQAVAIARWEGICGQITSTVYDLVVEIYHELLFSELQAALFAEIQSKVDGALAISSGTALNKIERISDRLRDGDPESVSQALTTCRRLIDSCADHLFPSREDAYDLGEGTTLKVNQQNVLNRLQAHCHERGVSKRRRDRLRRTLADLYERCSAGTHAEVTVQEARFVFLQTYVALGEVLTCTGATDTLVSTSSP